MQTLLFPVYRRTLCAIEIPESRKNIGITCKVNNNLITIAPNPPSTPQWNGKQSLLTADNCISCLSSLFRQNSKKQNLVQIQESHRNRTKTASSKKKNAAKPRNWIEVDRKWSRVYANITISGLPPDSMRNRDTGITQKYRNHM